MIIISTESHYLIGDISLPWMEEVDVPDEQAALLLTYPGIIAKNTEKIELLSEPSPIPSSSPNKKTTKPTSEKE